MMPNGAANFRSTIVKPYKRELKDDKNSPPNTSSPAGITSPTDIVNDPNFDSDYNDELDDFLPRFQPPPIKQGRGRPKGSKNRPKTAPTTVFMMSKERVDMELAHKLRTVGKITTPGKLFEISDKTEIDALIVNGVFRFE
jgi:hypothetical protein